jgi:hypothetical protein
MKHAARLALCGLLGMTGGALAQDRAPATPLITHDPYFSVWSMSDKLTGSETKHWTGSEQPMTGLARIDGKTYRFLGRNPESVSEMKQVAHSISAPHTRYAFEQSGVRLELAFFTPALPGDLDVLSRPVTYMTVTASATDSAKHKISVLFDVAPVIAVNDRSQKVTSFRQQTEELADCLYLPESFSSNMRTALSLGNSGYVSSAGSCRKFCTSSTFVL